LKCGGKAIRTGSRRLWKEWISTILARRWIRYVSADRIVAAPDCGMKYLPRDVAFAKMQAMVAGAALVRSELVKNSMKNGVKSS